MPSVKVKIYGLAPMVACFCFSAGATPVRPGGALRARGYLTDGPLEEGSSGRLPEEEPSGRRETFVRVRLDAWVDADAPASSLSGRLALRAEHLSDRDEDPSPALAEAFVLWDHAAWLPLSFRAGRQPLEGGRPFPAGEGEDDRALDGLRVESDLFPWELEAGYGRLAHTGTDTPVRDLGWLGAWRTGRGLSGVGAFAAVLPLDNGGRPVTAGLSGRWQPRPAWLAEGEAHLQRGSGPGGLSQRASLLQLLASRRWEDLPGEPALSARWTLASGGGEERPHRAFIPLPHGEHWGSVFSPRLSNLQVFTLRAAWTPAQGLSLSAAGHALRQVRPVPGPASDGTHDQGGYLASANGHSRHLGEEIELALSWQPDERFSLEIHAGHFLAGHAFDSSSSAGQEASKIRAAGRLRF